MSVRASVCVYVRACVRTCFPAQHEFVQLAFSQSTLTLCLQLQKVHNVLANHTCSVRQRRRRGVGNVLVVVVRWCMGASYVCVCVCVCVCVWGGGKGSATQMWRKQVAPRKKERKKERKKDSTGSGCVHVRGRTVWKIDVTLRLDAHCVMMRFCTAVHCCVRVCVSE